MKRIPWPAWLLAPCLWAFVAPLHAELLVVTLLGTGTPAPQFDRLGPAVLVEAGDHKLLFDAGRGVAQRINELQQSFSEINKVFVTHLHYDHVVGLPDLLMSGWVFQRDTPLTVWGPEGITAHLEHLAAAYEIDIQSRLAYTRLSPQGIRYNARPLTEGVVYERGGVKVTAFRVDHGEFKSAWGYRVDYAGRSVVISGDTRYSKNLVRYARNVDLLVHEISAAADALRKSNPRLEKVLAYHTSPEALARVLTETAPRFAVLTHLVVFGVDDDELLAAVSRGHKTEVVIGRDLMAFDVGEVIRPYSRAQRR